MFNLNISEEKRQLLIQFKNVIFIFLLLMDFIFIILITFVDLSYNVLFFMVSFDLFICLLLFIHLCFDYKDYDKGSLSFIKDYFFDIVAVIPFNFIFFRYLAVFRMARFLQFFQVFKIFKVGGTARGSLKYFIQNRLFEILVVIVFIYILFSSVILTQIDSSFSTIFDAFWFNVVTMTSVGYGDITPASYSGKLLSMFSIVMGIVFVSIFTAAMSALYMEKQEEETKNHIQKQIEKFVGHLKEENEKLNERIDTLESENEKLNEKLDVVIDLLNEKE
ncbi:MAG: hypothetical protein BZ135_00705 [Methanosphaera sp. rholeuAM6]|nr:MAG: hypothetical protein BZ135_00705 [Methanosphaera sp. rholeuAM6]